jgi:hypothetical protein
MMKRTTSGGIFLSQPDRHIKLVIMGGIKKPPAEAGGLEIGGTKPPTEREGG